MRRIVVQIELEDPIQYMYIECTKYFSYNNVQCQSTIHGKREMELNEWNGIKVIHNTDSTCS